MRITFPTSLTYYNIIITGEVVVHSKSALLVWVFTVHVLKVSKLQQFLEVAAPETFYPTAML